MIIDLGSLLPNRHGYRPFFGKRTEVDPAPAGDPYTGGVMALTFRRLEVFVAVAEDGTSVKPRSGWASASPPSVPRSNRWSDICYQLFERLRALADAVQLKAEVSCTGT